MIRKIFVLRIIPLLFLVSFSLQSFAVEPLDTLSLLRHNTTPWYKTNIMKSVYVAAPMVGFSFALRPVKEDFRSMSLDMGREKSWQWEDYVQYTPLAACYIMKLSGVKGRTSWGRMLVSHAFAAGTMTALVNGLKYSAKEMRPDGSAKNSFPSGHTATAFMAATLLHREYGHVSPWISIGGYTVATATGVGRIIHNRHWAPDVFCGAAIGVVTGELGYYLGDLIFRDKYMHKFPERENFDRFHNPSNLSLKVGVAIPVTDYTVTYYNQEFQYLAEMGIRFLTGSDVALDGAYFFNPYVGIGGSLHIVSSNVAVQTKVIGNSPDANLMRQLIGGKELNSNCNLTAYNTTLNVHGSYPFSQTLRLDAKMGGGYSHSNIHLDPYRNNIYSNAYQQLESGTLNPELNDFASSDRVMGHQDEKDIRNTKPTSSIVLSTGVSLHFTPTSTLDASIYMDWNMMTNMPLIDVKKKFNMFNTGLSCAMRF